MVDEVDGKRVGRWIVVFCFMEGDYSWSWCFVAYTGNVGLTEGSRRVGRDE